MIVGTGLLPKQAQPCHGTGSWIVEEITKQDEAQGEEKQEQLMKDEEKNKTKEEKYFHLQN